MEFFTIGVPIVTYDILENFEPYNDFLEFLTRSRVDKIKKTRRR